MIDIRFFEHGKSMKDKIISDMSLDILPLVGDVIVCRGSNTEYVVKCRCFVVTDMPPASARQQVALGVERRDASR